MHRLLIVATDTTAARPVGMALEAGGFFRTTLAANLAEAITRGTAEAIQVETAQYEAILLVIGASADSPAMLCGRLRQVWTHCPIIVLAQQAGELDVVRSLDAGASDFITAPYRTSELQARLRAQIRSHANSEAQTFQIGPYRFQPQKRVLHHVSTNAVVRLTHKESEVLKFLLRADGAPVGRQTLLRDLWGYKDGADSYTVESHIYRLRRKLEADPSRPRFLLNEAGGYVLIPAPARPWPPARRLSEYQLAG
jgi:DNA-binding response OmpR family regulator